MGRLKDLTGKKFGKLLVIGNHKNKKVCICDCGNICEIDTNHLMTGHSKSCGCGNARYWKTALGMSQTKLYKVLRGIKERCLNKNSIAYKYYGERGISICNEWMTSKNFLEWALSSGYKEGMTIDRINVNGDYCPENCRWITMNEQNRNKRNNILIKDNNNELCLKDYCLKYGIDYRSCLYYKKKYNNLDIKDIVLFVLQRKREKR